MSRTLEGYIAEVEAAVMDLTGDVFSLSDLIDYSDGELSLTDMFFEGVLPRDAARMKLNADGYLGAVNCWSDECDECPLEYRCPHIG